MFLSQSASFKNSGYWEGIIVWWILTLFLVQMFRVYGNGFS